MASESKFTGTFTPADGAIKNTHFSNVADDALDADKMEHLYKPGSSFDLAIGGTPATREEVVFVASSAGILRAAKAMLNVTGSSTSIAFDVKKNGTTMLTGAFTIVNGDADTEVKTGTISGTGAFVADDVLSIVMTVTSSTGAQGPFAWLEVQELAG